MRKGISLVLSLILLFSLVQPTYASQVNKQGSLSGLKIDENTWMFGEDLENGDARISLVKDAVVIFESYINRKTGEITYTDYLEDKTTTDYVAAIPNSAQPQARDYFSTVGYITYDWYMPDQTTPSGTRRIKLESMTEVDVIENFNLNGKYKNIAEFAAVIVAGLHVAATYGVEILAPQLLTWLDFGTVVTNIIIGDEYVRMTKTALSWRFSDANVSSFSKTIVGYKYQYSLNGHTKTDTYGQWWPANSYTLHDTAFAYSVYTTLWGTDTQAVLKSWS